MKPVLTALLAFLLAFVALRQLQPDGILFYQGVGLGLAIAGLQVCALAWLGSRRLRDVMKDGLLSFLLIYAFVFTVPTTVDRAYSVKMIGHLAQAPQGLSKEEVGHMYIDDFIRQGGIDKRLREQLATGSLQEQDGRYRLTPFGQMLASSFKLSCRLFACTRSAQ